MTRPWREPPAMPTGLDPVAGPGLHSVPKAARLDALRRAAIAAMKAGGAGDHEVGYVAELILDAIASNRPMDILTDLGISTHGGVSPSSASDLREKYEMIRSARSSVQEWREAPARSAALAMIRNFGEYEARAWPRDRDRGVAPTTQPRRTWFEILARGWRMPGTAKHLALYL